MSRPWFLLLLFGFASVVSIARGADFIVSKEEVRTAVDTVLARQLAEFRRPDYAAARALAAAPLQAKFSVEEFERMIRRGYPRIARHTAARLGEVRDNGTRALALVTLVDPDGTEAVFRYVLFLEPEGWRIGGVAEAVSSSGGL